MLQELVELRVYTRAKASKTPKPKSRPSSSKYTPTLALINEDEEIIYSSGEEDEEEEWKIDDDFLDLDLDLDLDADP